MNIFYCIKDSLEHMELESVAFTLGDNLNFPNLSSLNLDSCEVNKSKELIRRVSSQLEYLHLENYLQDFGLKLDLAEVLRSEKDAFKKLKERLLNLQFLFISIIYIFFHNKSEIRIALTWSDRMLCLSPVSTCLRRALRQAWRSAWPAYCSG